MNLTENCVPNEFENTTAGIIITHVSITIAILGIPVNVLTLAVLRRTATKGPTNLLLVVLATEDTLIIISYSIYYVATHYFENYHLTYLEFLKYADSVLHFLLSWIKMTEIYTIVLLSLQRYIAIRWPLQVARMCSVGRTKRTLVVVIILSAALKLPNLILGYQNVSYNPECNQYILYSVFRNEPWFDHFKLIHVQVLDQIIGYYIPLCALIVLNFGLIMRVRKAMKQRSNDSKTYTENTEITQIRSIRVRQARNSTFRTKPETASETASNSSQTIIDKNNHNFGGTIRTQTVHGPSVSQGPTQSKGVTLTLIGVVSTFIVFETPTTICFTYEMWEYFRPSTPGNAESTDHFNLYYYLYPTALVCVLIGCTSNFFIYMLVGSKFRKACVAVMRELFSRRYWRRRCRNKTRNENRTIRELYSIREPS